MLIKGTTTRFKKVITLSKLHDRKLRIQNKLCSEASHVSDFSFFAPNWFDNPHHVTSYNIVHLCNVLSLCEVSLIHVLCITAATYDI